MQKNRKKCELLITKRNKASRLNKIHVNLLRMHYLNVNEIIRKISFSCGTFSILLINYLFKVSSYASKLIRLDIVKIKHILSIFHYNCHLEYQAF